MDQQDNQNNPNLPQSAGDNIAQQYPASQPYQDQTNWQNPAQQAQNVPVQYPAQTQVPQQYPQQYPQPQPAQPTPSPEVPARVDSGEAYIPTEAQPEVQKVPEKPTEVEKPPEDKAIKTPEQVPDQKKFESPFRVTGYQASPKMVSMGKKKAGKKISGKISLAQTWLLVLLGRILKMSAKI